MAASEADPLASWTERLLRLSDGIAPDEARAFVHDLYTHAQSELDEARAAADFERDE